MNGFLAPALSVLEDQARKGLEHVFSIKAEVIAAAPGRVNLIGEHTDYNDGLVLPLAIDRRVVVAGARHDSTDRAAAVFSEQFERVASISLAATAERHREPWANYVQGVVQGFLKRGVRIPCFQAFVLSNVPLGGGLSSSAALEVAMATFLEALTGVTLDQREKALLCQQAEHDFAGVPCGIMDQLSSIMGRSDHLLLLDCRSRQVEQVPFHPLGISVLVTNSHVRHELGGTQYAQRRRECEQALEILGVPTLRDATRQAVERAENELGEVIRRRVRHVVDEIERVELAVAAARAGNWDRLGELMYASHDSLRDDYEVSCPELDLLVELARSLHGAGGVVGSRMTGGGFGGCTVSLVRSDRVDEVTDFVAQQYRRQTGIDPSFFLTRPSHGCVMLQG